MLPSWLQVISTAGVSNTYGRLLPLRQLPSITNCKQELDVCCALLLAAAQAHYVLYLAVDDAAAA